MHESAHFFSNVEWPAPGARLAGPVVWLRGWIVGKPGHDFIDVRVRHDGRTHLGVLGLPRVDLAAHFKSERVWLPAEFILGVPVADGAVSLTVEAMDALGAWHALPTINVTLAADGAPAPSVEGRLETSPDGTWTVRDAHHPFHGHCDQPGPTPALRHGRAPVFGWLLDETRPLSAVLATTDTLVFNHLAHSLTDDSLAARVQHPGARHARLRGEVDFPATLPATACLRLYAVSPDNSVHLCFAQRITAAARDATPAPTTALSYSNFPEAALPELPSARPRRLLIVLRSLFPNDATLRAFDLAQHLIASHRWAARVVSTEDGPLRAAFENAGADSLIVDPDPLFSSPNEAAMKESLERLRRRIRWDYLDAVAVFDPVCGWAITLARRQKIPVLFDCSITEPCAPDATAISAVQSLLRDSWQASTAMCFASQTAAHAQSAQLGTLPARVIPQWHTPGLPGAVNSAPDSRVVLAPLRTLDWLRRYHPATASRWIFQQGPAGLNSAEKLAQPDDARNAPALQRASNWSVEGIALCIGPLFDRGPLRPLIDATARGIPVVAPRLAVTEEIFRDTRVQLIDEADPASAAHALLAWEALPASFQREADTLAPIFRERHAPARLLAEWEALLASVAATRS